MDEETMQELELEIAESLNIDNDGESIDTVDGFKKYIRKRFYKICAREGDTETPELTAKGASCAASQTDHRGQGDSDVGDSYDFTHRKRGLAIIINNEDFTSGLDNRRGSTRDALSLHRTFKKLGFEVLMNRNLRAREMLEVLRAGTTNYDHANADCFVCAILTHGRERLRHLSHEKMAFRAKQDLLYGTDGTTVSTEHIIEFFSDENCHGLKGKPRLFFIQACRGIKTDSGVGMLVTAHTDIPQKSKGKKQDGTDGGCSDDEPPTTAAETQEFVSGNDHSLNLETDVPDAKPMGGEEGAAKPAGRGDGADMTDAWSAYVRDVPVAQAPLYKDSLIMYATTPGHFAWRRDSGSWFVQALCDVLDNSNLQHKSLLKALVHVVGKVALDYESNNRRDPDKHKKKETPVIESMLVKDVFFIKKMKH